MGYHVTDLLAAASAASIPVVQGVTEEHFPGTHPMLGFVAEMGPMARKMGVFGEPFDVPGNDFERLLGATGRNPVAPRV